MGPSAHADGYDFPWPFDELVPGLTAERANVVVGFEDAVREPVVSDVLPDVLDRVEFGRARRQRHEGDVVGDGQLRRHVPSGLIDNHHRMGARVDGLADLGQMQFHRRNVAVQASSK
jgi:hypothetical protein